MDFDCIPIECEYICADEGYSKLIKSISPLVEEGDLLVISETPISTIEGNLVDESEYSYSLISLIICEFWCKIIWGYLLSFLNYDRRTISNLRRMPVEARNHKEFILKRYGLKHALMPSGEAGVDLSNVPDSFVSLLPENPDNSAFIVKKMLKDACGVNAEVMIIDTDPTYVFFGRYFTSIPSSVSGIANDLGIYGYILRFFSKHAGATPLAVTYDETVGNLIKYANIAEDCQINALDNFFETVYNMTDTFNVGFDDISEDMLKKVRHVPAVIIRRKYL